MKKEYLQKSYHGMGKTGYYTYHCKICGQRLNEDGYAYCPFCGGNLSTGQLPLNLYVEGYRNGLTTGKMLREEQIDG